MTESVSSSALLSLLHELAERLQATGNHVSVARRIIMRDGSRDARLAETLERAVDEMTCTERAFHCLRDHLIEGQQYERDAIIALVGSGAAMLATEVETSEESGR